jgi:ubiquinone/menaquinone biosynthesis C-methylase UbiE
LLDPSTVREPRPVDAVVGFFDYFADRYETWAQGLHVRVARRLVEWVEPQRGELVLDVGAGTGLVANRAAELVWPSGRVIGLDVSIGMLELAYDRAPANASYELVHLEDRLPFPASEFDLVTFGDSLPYFKEPFRMLEEARRVLRPGGRIGLSLRQRSLVTEAQKAFYRLLDEELTEALPFVVPRYTREDHGKLGEPEAVEDLLQDAGFGPPRITQLVTGLRMESGLAWIDLLQGAGPWPHALLSTLGPDLRRQLASAVEREMSGLGDEAFRYHEAFIFVSAHRRG